jgi:dGTPase
MSANRDSRTDVGIDSAVAETIGRYEAFLSPSATRSCDAVRRYNRKEADIRSPFSRDADRIIHTRAYTRYIDKTQVFYLVDNDHITHRLIHVQLVSRIARTIGRGLGLNEDLIEAIALGHDIGHTPHGHFGETCLSDLCEREGIGKFCHNVQSVRFLDAIEDCDLTMQVLDGILCHNGETDDARISPAPCSSWEEFDEKVRRAQKREGIQPMTFEGCVVKFADTISYIGRDLQDAREIGLIDESTLLPEISVHLLGSTNRDIINTLICDLLNNSSVGAGGYISYSRNVEDALRKLRAFSRTNIYENPKLTVEREKIRLMYSVLFAKYLDDIVRGRMDSRIYAEFIDSDVAKEGYLAASEKPEIVRDFIAGMTDRYFGKRYEECVLPRKIDGKFR